jgi:hypothetical protein
MARGRQSGEKKKKKKGAEMGGIAPRIAKTISTAPSGARESIRAIAQRFATINRARKKQITLAQKSV